MKNTIVILFLFAIMALCSVKAYRYYKNKQSEVVKDNSIVMIGCSLTKGFKDLDMLPDVVNLGHGGEETKDILKRLSKITARPRMVFLEGGTNDLLHGVPVDSIISRYCSMIDIALKICPKVYANSILPTGKNPEFVSQKDVLRISEQVIIINSGIKAYCAKRGVVFIDTYSLFGINGFLSHEYEHTDGIHLNERAYIQWEKMLLPLLITH